MTSTARTIWQHIRTRLATRRALERTVRHQYDLICHLEHQLEERTR